MRRQIRKRGREVRRRTRERGKEEEKENVDK